MSNVEEPDVNYKPLWWTATGRVLGRAATLLSVVAALGSLVVVLPHLTGAGWLLVGPYLLYEGGVALCGIFQTKGVAWASNWFEVLVPVAGTWLYPLAVSYGGPMHPAPVWIMACIFLWLAWSIISLRTNFSVMPEARRLAASGPYRLVRHPLYVGYIALWLVWAFSVGGWLTWMVALVGIGLFWVRASMEERKMAAVPGYNEYKAKTGMFIPAVLIKRVMGILS